VATAGVCAMGQLLKVMQIAYRTESVPEELQKSEISHIFKTCKKRNARTTEAQRYFLIVGKLTVE